MAVNVDTVEPARTRSRCMAEYWNQDIERMSHAGIESMQSALRRTQLPRVVAASPFYARKFAESGCDPSTVLRMADLRRVPFTEKSELRESQVAAPPLGHHAAAPLE